MPSKIPLNYIHTVIFDGMPSVGKTTIMKVFNNRTNNEYLTYEGGALSYIVKAKSKEINNPLPGKLFCIDYRHTLIVFIHARKIEIMKRIANDDKPRINVPERYDLYLRGFKIMKKYCRNYLIVENNDKMQAHKAIEQILKFLEPRKHPRLKKLNLELLESPD